MQLNKNKKLNEFNFHVHEREKQVVRVFKLISILDVKMTFSVWKKNKERRIIFGKEKKKANFSASTCLIFHWSVCMLRSLLAIIFLMIN